MASAEGGRKTGQNPVFGEGVAEIRLFQRSRQGALGFGGELRLVPAYEIGADGKHDESSDSDRDHYRPGDVLHLVPEEIGGKTECGRPRKGADAIGEQE